MPSKKSSMARPASEPAHGAGELLDALTRERGQTFGNASGRGKKFKEYASGKAILGLDAAGQLLVLTTAVDRLVDPQVLSTSDRYHAAVWVTGELLRRQPALPEGVLVHLLDWPVRREGPNFNQYCYPLEALARAAERYVNANGISRPVKQALAPLIANLQRASIKEHRTIAGRFQALLGGGARVVLEPGEAWSDAALADLKAMTAGQAQSWNAFLLHCQKGGAGKYSADWQREAEPLLAAVGFDAFQEHLLRWLPLVNKPRTRPMERRNTALPDPNQLLQERHIDLLRGLAWCCGLREDAELARALARLALSAYRKIPGKGPRLVSLGGACVTALGLMPGPTPVGQLAALQIKVKFGTARKEIEKSLHAAAAREGLPRDELEELAVPTYGLEEVGRLRASLGDHRAELSIDGSSVRLHWRKGDRPLKSAPAAVRSQYPEEYKGLQAALKDLSAMLPAQRERVDTLFLARKAWPLAAWRERYLDHPLVGTIARRLIWTFTAKSRVADGIWHGGELVGRDGKPLNLAGEATVSLWHPIDRPTDEVLAWRDWLERREVVQPFKQAHREVYLLTDAERRTATYSNRFAAHVLRQHQFHALCAVRGWRNKLRLMVDDSYPPAHRPLPAWGLRAEYWVEGAGSEYGVDTNASGAYLYLTTDQVRFYALDAPQLQAHAGGGGYGRRGGVAADPLSLGSVPPLVFSEVMRDVDLFVGVASVGNDPDWVDGGPGGRYRDYWQTYSFGDLSATARTRRALLERLLPRLRIADRCSLSERFLHVRGDLRGYKIHLGSGNILMSPNDQYLCIVPRQATAGHEPVFLPFEGDGVLSLILSKAFLLAGDVKITDPSITRQLRR